jgi:glycosyltransferase involved in cell wall biosynthesis
MSVLLTAIVPVAKMSGRLDAMKSWLDQIDPNILEVILVHDNHDAKTGQELREIIEQFPSQKITIIEGKFGSPGAARNAGLEQARGDWVTFWDSDDIPNVTEFLIMLKNANFKGYEITVGGYETASFQSDGVTNPLLVLPSIGEWGSNIPLNPGLWRWAFKRTVVGKMRFENFLMGEDQCFLVTLKPTTKKIHIHEKSVYMYHLNRDGQLTGNSIAINDISKSIRYLRKSLNSRKEKPNYFDLVILFRQSATAIKKGNLKVKVIGFQALVSYLVSSLIFNPHSAVRALKCIYLFSLRKKPAPPASEVLMIGGLGNQFFQLAAGLHFTGANDLSISYSAHQKGIRGSEELSEFLLPSQVKIKKSKEFGYAQIKLVNFCIRLSAQVNETIKLRGIQIKMISNLQLLLGWISPGNWKVNIGIGFDKTHELNSSNYHIGYFQSRKYFEHPQVQETMKKITLHKPSQSFVKNKNELADLKSLVVHVRLGDYVREPDFGIPSQNYFHESIIKMWNRNIFTRICLFSNEPVSAVEYVPISLRSYIWMPSEDLLSSAETLELMRHGKGYVLSNSSFSWWAGALSYVDNASIICPTPWFERKNEPIDLIPKDWVRHSSVDFQ